MSLLLSTTSLVGPVAPPWLEEKCQRLIDNDPTFHTIELTHPRIDDVCARIFAKALNENTVATALILSCYAIVDDGAFAVASVLGSNKSITKLQLRDLRDSREISAFFHQLSENTELSEVSLRHCVICPRGAAAISSFLKRHPKLEEFRLTDSQLIGNALEILCCGMSGKASLQRIYLINNELNGADSAHHISRLIDGSFVQELYLGENNLADDGVEVICQAILHNSLHLRHLDVRSNGITPYGSLSLQGLLVNSRFLVSLNASGNELGDLGSIAVARGLQSTSCQMKKLDLSANDIGAGGAKAMSGMLRFNKRLEELNLSFNCIGDNGAKYISKGMQFNSSLRWLSLRRNDIGNTGAKFIAEKLPRMPGLKELLLSKNFIGEEGALALLQGLRANVELEYLHIEEIVSEPIGREIVHWIRLNKAGRRIFCKTNTVPCPLWSHVYGRISNDMDAVRIALLLLSK